MEVADPHTQPFRGFLGKRILLRGSSAEIVDVQIRGRSVCFVGREHGSELEFLVPLRYLLEHVTENRVVDCTTNG